MRIHLSICNDGWWENLSMKQFDFRLKKLQIISKSFFSYGRREQIIQVFLMIRVQADGKCGAFLKAVPSYVKYKWSAGVKYRYNKHRRSTRLRLIY